MPIGDIDQLTKTQAVTLAETNANYTRHLVGKTITAAHLLVESGVRVELRYTTDASKKMRRKKMRAKGTEEAVRKSS